MKTKRTLREHVVAITGASSGVGRAVARAFGAEGARVALIARNGEALAHAAEEIRSAGGEALAYRSIPLQSAYCAAKAAIRGFTEVLR